MTSGLPKDYMKKSEEKQKMEICQIQSGLFGSSNTK